MSEDEFMSTTDQESDYESPPPSDVKVRVAKEQSAQQEQSHLSQIIPRKIDFHKLPPSSEDEEEAVAALVDLAETKHKLKPISSLFGQASNPLGPLPLQRSKTFRGEPVQKKVAFVAPPPFVSKRAFPPSPPSPKEVSFVPPPLSSSPEVPPLPQVFKANGKKAKSTANSRSMNWCFTFNNYCKEDIDAFKKIECKYIVIGEEVGDQGTPHLQGTICFQTLKTFKQLKELFGIRAHLEPTIDLQASIVYCKKDGKYHEVGVQPDSQIVKGNKEQARWDRARELAIQGRLEEIDSQIYICHLGHLEQVRARAMRKSVLENTFETHYWMYGATGTGKSRTAREMFPGAFVKMLNKWWGGYEAQTCVILDDVDPTACGHMAHLFKTWVDHYPFPAEIKGSEVVIRPKQFVVTSNYRIEECFPNERDWAPMYRRFKVLRFENDGIYEVNRPDVVPGDTTTFNRVPPSSVWDVPAPPPPFADETPAVKVKKSRKH